MEALVGVAIAGAAIVPLILNIRLLFGSMSRNLDGLGILAVVTVVLGGLLYEANILPRGQSMQIVFFALIGMSVFVGGVKVFGPAAGRRATLNLQMFLPAFISAIMFLANAIFNPGLPLEQSLGRLLAVAILVLISLGTAIFNLQLSDLCRIILISILTILLISPLQSINWRPCDVFKCGPFGAIYTGPFASENALAIFCCVALLCVFATWSGAASFWNVVPLTLALYASESRTSQLALVASLAAWAISVVWRKAFRTVRVLSQQGLAFSFAVTTVAAVSFYLLFTAEPSSFSNRGNIWIRGLSALDGQWWSGLGLDRWTYLQSAGILPLLFPHNQNLLLLFGGGILAVALLYMLLISSVRSSARDEATVGFGVAYAIFVSVLGLTEAYWNPLAFDGHTFLILPLVFLVAGRTSCSDERLRPRRHGAKFQMARYSLK